MHFEEEWLIKKILITLVIIICLIIIAFIPIRLHSTSSPEVIHVIAEAIVIPESIPDKVTYFAKKYNVDNELAHYIAINESHYNPKAIGDMFLICARTGLPVRARGVFQITECYHNNVTDEEAFDPNFNIEYAMQLISKGKQTCISQFSTCRRYYSN